jgi:hypothetical protein
MGIEYCLKFLALATFWNKINYADGVFFSNNVFISKSSELAIEAHLIRQESKYIEKRRKFQSRWGFDIDVSNLMEVELNHVYVVIYFTYTFISQTVVFNFRNEASFYHLLIFLLINYKSMLLDIIVNDSYGE